MAVSSSYLPAGQDGWIEIPINPLGQQEIGFTDQPSITSQADIDFAWLVHYNSNRKEFRVRENTTAKFDTGVTPQIGDVLKLERIGTTVTYYLNGNAVYTSTKSSSTDLDVGITIWHITLPTNQIHTSFTQKNYLGKIIKTGNTKPI